MCRGGTKHACTSCDRLFQDSWDLKEHKKEVHGEVVEEEEEVEKGEKGGRRRSTRLGRFTGDMQDNEEEKEKEDDDDVTLEEIVAV